MCSITIHRSNAAVDNGVMVVVNWYILITSIVQSLENVKRSIYNLWLILASRVY